MWVTVLRWKCAHTAMMTHGCEPSTRRWRPPEELAHLAWKYTLFGSAPGHRRCRATCTIGIYFYTTFHRGCNCNRTSNRSACISTSHFRQPEQPDLKLYYFLRILVPRHDRRTKVFISEAASAHSSREILLRKGWSFAVCIERPAHVGQPCCPSVCHRTCGHWYVPHESSRLR